MLWAKVLTVLNICDKIQKGVICMFCMYCGREMADDSVFCQHCGKKVECALPQEVGLKSEQGENVDGGYADSGFCGGYSAPSMGGAPNDRCVIAQPELPMKWHKFNIYFALFAAIFLNAFFAVMHFFGYVYFIVDSSPELVYEVFPLMSVVDKVYGILLLATAAFCIFVRMRLAGFYKSGPMWYYILLALSTILAVAYSVGCAIAMVVGTVELGLDITLLESDFVTMVQDGLPSHSPTVLTLLLSAIYYNKRKHLFVN